MSIKWRGGRFERKEQVSNIEKMLGRSEGRKMSDKGKRGGRQMKSGGNLSAYSLKDRRKKIKFYSQWRWTSGWPLCKDNPN